MSGFIDDRRDLSAAAARFAKDCQYFTGAIEKSSEAMNARQKLAKTLATFLTNATKMPVEMISSIESYLNPKHGIDPTRQPPGSGSVAAEIAPGVVALAVLRNHKDIFIADAGRLTVTDILRIIYGGHLEGIKRTSTTPKHLRGFLVSFSFMAAAEAFMAWTTTSSFRATILPEHLFVKYKWARRELYLSEKILRAASMVGARCSVRILNFPASLAKRTLYERIRGLFKIHGSFDIHLFALNEFKGQFNIVAEHIGGAMALKSWFDKGLLGPGFQNSEMVYIKDPNEHLEIPQIAEAQMASHGYERGGVAQNLPSNPAPRERPARYRHYNPQHRLNFINQPTPAVSIPTTGRSAQGAGSQLNEPAWRHLAVRNRIQGNAPPLYSTMQGQHPRAQAGTPVTYVYLHMRGLGKALGENSQGVAQKMEGPTASSRQVPGQLGRGAGNNVKDEGNGGGDGKDGKKVGGKDDEKNGEKANEGEGEVEEEDLIFFWESEDENSERRDGRLSYNDYAEEYEGLLC